MMLLFSSPLSPFARKVRIAAAHLGLADEMELVATDVLDPNDRIRTENPLGKIPALVPDGGPLLFDSAVILEFLDHRAGGGRLLPKAPDARFRVLTAQALADGLIDAAVLQVYEGRFRPEELHSARWLEHQAGKVARTLAYFEHAPLGDEVTAATIALACALGYLDFRFPGTWRATYPTLVAWLDGFSRRVPSFAATRPVPPS